MSESKTAELLNRESAALGVVLTVAQQENLLLLATRLLEINQRVNLTSARDLSALVHDHVLDSLTLVPLMQEQKTNIANDSLLVDVGSGGGFPALPLAILFPAIRVVCIESVVKKARAIEALSASINLASVTVIAARAETTARDPRWREQADWATARAVGSLATVCELCLPFLRIGGYFLAQRGADAAAELSESLAVVSRLGGLSRRLVAVGPDRPQGRHQVVLLEKVASTPSEFPRRPGLPAKRPLRA